MTNVRAISARRLAAASLIAASLVGVSACSSINEQATTKQYNASDGVAVSVDSKDAKAAVRNLMIVSNGKDKEGRILGNVVNEGTSPVDVKFAVDGQKVGQPISLKESPDNSVSLSTSSHALVVKSTPKGAGELVDVTVTIGSTEKTVQVPVLDGTLEQYRDLIPGGASPVPTETKASQAPGH